MTGWVVVCLVAWLVIAAIVAIGMGRAMHHAALNDYKDRED